MTMVSTHTVVRLATLDDLIPCVELIRALRRATFWQHVMPDDDPFIGGVLLAHRLLAEPTTCLYVAEADGQIVGICGGEITRHFMSPHIQLLHEWAWWMQEEYRTTMLGGRLWLAVCEWGKTKGARVAFRAKIRTNLRNGRYLGEEAYTVEELTP